MKKIKHAQVHDFLIRLSMLIIILLIGILSLFYLEKQLNNFPEERFEVTNRPRWFIYPQSSEEDCDRLFIPAELPKVDPRVNKISESDLELICKLVYGEGRGLNKTEMSAIIWCVFNRVDSPKFPNTIREVVTQKSQFSGYSPSHPILDNIKSLVIDVFEKWELEKLGYKEVGRTLPKTYLFFIGDGKHNYYMENWKSKIYYNWSLPSPY